MFTTNQTGFTEMDRLSANQTAFVFFVDFLMKTVEIYEIESLLNESIWLDFPNFKNKESPPKASHSVTLERFPENFNTYKKGFDEVQQHLKLGNTYLANYTRKTPISLNCDLQTLYENTRAKYKIYYKNEFVCFSPECFIKIENQQISTFPMKGTIDAEVEDAVEKLKTNPKETAEHCTVTDLLRNDLSQVANEVNVIDFQKIELIQTAQKNLFTMSTEISGTLKPKFQGKIGSILKQVLPAGSILGAPKAKTLEIIQKAEQYPRGWYTGVCGYFDGSSLDSCVMIRFIENEANQFYFKSGGGITHRSVAQEEYQEMINKIYVPIF